MLNFRTHQTATFVSLFVLFVLCYYVYSNIWKNATAKSTGNLEQYKKIRKILIWTHNHTEPFNRFKYGRESFIDAGCEVNNCFVTNDRRYLSDVAEWDAILFHAPEYTWPKNSQKHGHPSARSHRQIYIFACIESAANYPVCDEKFDGYFNWTMTYKLDSDIQWQYITIKDSKNIVIGPKKNMNWEHFKGKISDKLKNVLEHKTKVAAWFVSNCNSLSKRIEYAYDLRNKLKDIGLSLDIYGKCGDLKCEINNMRTCLQKLSADYHFYLSFENSFSEDYVTEKFLTAVQNDVVPIVFGGADYTRFAANSSFINAKSYSPSDLAAFIKQLIDHKERYEEYFLWRDHYSYHAPTEIYDTHPFCKLCKALNDHHGKNDSKTYDDFRTWWNGDGNTKSVC